MPADTFTVVEAAWLRGNAEAIVVDAPKEFISGVDRRKAERNDEGVLEAVPLGSVEEMEGGG